MTSLNRTWTLYFHAKDKSKNYVAGLIQTFLFGVIYLNKLKKL